MNDYRSLWNDELIRQGKSGEQIQLAQAEQQHLQAQLPDLSEEEAQLVSLSRMGVRFTLEQQAVSATLHQKAAFLLLVQFLLSRLPGFLGYPFSNATEGLYGLNVSFLVFPILALYLVRGQKRLLVHYLLGSALLALVINLLFLGNTQTESPTLVLAILHLPPLYVLSLALFDQHESLTEKLCRHLSLVGETLLLTFLLACATGFSMLLTILLFEAIGWKVEDGVASFVITGIIPLLPLTALHLLKTKGAKMQQITRLLATLFLPVFTLLMAVFLMVLLFGKVHIVEDRSLLLVIDVLLAMLLLMILYAADLLEHQQKSRMGKNLIIIACSIALALDVVALLAIGKRLNQYGLSPNRLAVLAENILLFGNLLFLVITLIRKQSAAKLQARFLLLYAFWFLFVVLAFPLLF